MKSFCIRSMPGVLLGVSALFLAACGGGGGGGGDSDPPVQMPPPDPGATGVSGKITAPNGETPIAGVTVYYTGSAQGQSPPVPRALGMQSQQGCAPPADSNALWACTDQYGYFVLEFDSLDPVPETLPIHFIKGKWSGQANVGALGEYAGVMPFSSDPDAGAPRIAVITGSFDQIENVLVRLGMTSNPAQGQSLTTTAAPAQETARHFHRHDHSAVQPRMGLLEDDPDIDFCDPPDNAPPWWPPELPWPPPPEFCLVQPPPEWLGSETFDLYIGSRQYADEGENYPGMEELFELVDGQPRLLNYDILYVNCDAPEPEHANWEQDVTQFVNQGGLLYVTDLSSAWVAEPFYAYVGPDYTTFGGVDTGDRVQVVDTVLRNWMRAMPCRNGNACVDGNGRFSLTGYGDDVLEPYDPAVVPLVTEVSGNRVLTLRFPHGDSAGQVFFSTFHTADQSYGGSGRTAEERMLEYLFYAD